MSTKAECKNEVKKVPTSVRIRNKIRNALLEEVSVAQKIKTQSVRLEHLDRIATILSKLS